MGNYQPTPPTPKPPTPLTKIEELTNEIEGERKKLRKNRIKIEDLDKRYYEIDDEINRPDTFVDHIYPQIISEQEKIKQYERSHPGEIKALEDQYNMLSKEKEEIVERIKSLDIELTNLQKNRT